MDQDHKQQLISYITAARESGMTHEDVVNALQQHGWSTADIVAALVPSSKPENSEKSKTYAIQAANVSKSFGTIKALDNVSIAVEKGAVLGLLGPNGAGKTTLVRILATLLRPDNGTITVANYDVVRDKESVKSVIGLTGQYAAIDERLTGYENLVMIGRLYHLNNQIASERATELLAQFSLTEAANRIARTYSGGMRRRLDIAASLVNKPLILFLDEPTTGLDPQSRIVLWDIIKQLVASGTTVLLTTQYLEEADHLADTIVVIDHGTIIARGTAQELKSQLGGDVVEIHLDKPSDLAQAQRMLRQLTNQQLKTDADLGTVALPAEHGAHDLVEVVRLLDQARIPIADIALRRPTLDDVFLKLTGHNTQ